MVDLVTPLSFDRYGSSTEVMDALGIQGGAKTFTPGTLLASLESLLTQPSVGWITSPATPRWHPPAEAETVDTLIHRLAMANDSVAALQEACQALHQVRPGTPGSDEDTRKLLEFIILRLQAMDEEGPPGFPDTQSMGPMLESLRAASIKLGSTRWIRPAHSAKMDLGLNPIASKDSVAAKARHVPWVSQFSLRHGAVACFRAAVKMAHLAGATVLGPGSRIQIAVKKDAAGAVTVNPARAKMGRDYIDGELGAGRPVVVGVSHSGQHHNVDDLTDHFVVITTRGVDEQGRVYYAFNDPGTKDAAAGADTNPNNRFYVDGKTGKLFRPGDRHARSVLHTQDEVTMVRRNSEVAA